MIRMPSPEEHADNCFKLITRARTSLEAVVRLNASDDAHRRELLVDAEEALAVRPWPRRWWNYAKRAPALYDNTPLLQTMWLLAALAIGLYLPYGWLIAAVATTAACVYLVVTGYRQTSAKAADLRRFMKENRDRVGQLLPKYLHGRLVPPAAYSCSIHADGTRTHHPERRFAFDYSLTKAKTLAWLSYAAVKTSGDTLGRTPELDLATYATRHYANYQVRLAEKVAVVTAQLKEIGAWAWQDGTADLRDPANADRLAVTLELLELHERLEKLWRFNEKDTKPVDVRVTVASAEWVALATRVAILHHDCLPPQA